ncbi:MAG: zinc-binding dehydrogenase [Armatimonadetes bacterium]|nr:zinc-binding dehydrogenase [Armatimonadota bacterium]
MIKAYRVSFPEALRAELVEFELDERLQGKEVLVQAEYSVISPGTEGASFSGLEREHPIARNFAYPRATTGYGHLSRVLAVGPDVTDLKVGDRILSFSPHASYWKWDSGRFFLHVPPEADGKRAVFTRMAGVAITAVRKSSVQIGDTVAVVGLGLVGNFAAQLFQMAGAEVMGLDVAASRLERARQCGIQRVVNPTGRSAREAVLEWTGGQGARIVVEAIGRSDLILEGVEFTRRHGEILLLGSPRALHTAEVTPMLSRIHIQGITMIGALEWLYPIPELDFTRVSITRNYQQLLGWIMDGRLAIDPLLTHVLSPVRCQEAYMGLHAQKDEYLGVVFDWSLL